MLTRHEVLELIRGALEVKAISEESSSDNIEVWDSLGHLSILTALDDATNGQVADLTELAKAYSVKRILELLDRKSLLSK